MGLQQTWRWFGPDDPITLKEIKQTGATGIVTALHQIPIGNVWPIDEIKKRKKLIEDEGFTWSVVESLPVHEHIKKGTSDCKEFIERYKESIRNIGKCGIGTICYNFMPVLDWSRTNLRYEFKDGFITTQFELKAMAAFDLFILKRKSAEKDYTESQRQAAQSYFTSLNNEDRERLVDTILLGLPGSEKAYSLKQLDEAILQYKEIGEKVFRENLSSFLREIIPVADEAGVKMAIHPDDPPWPLLGLPRIVSNSLDLKAIIDAVNSPANGITFCTGSLGESSTNDVAAMAKEFAHRIHFLHLRNIKRTGEYDFFEDNHLEGDVDLFGVMKALNIEQKRRLKEEEAIVGIPFRPDHGHLMQADQSRPKVYPGYSLFGRMRALSELRGLEVGIERLLAE